MGERTLSSVGVYAFSYRTDLLSGNYRIGDAADLLHATLDLEDLLKVKKLIFVCHSLGGIVARRFIVARQIELLEKELHIGLFLVASPSLGSEYANWISFLAKALGNTQADALRFSESNSWLNDLDRDFQNLKSSNKLRITGKEFIEDESVFKSRWLKRPIVQEFSAARYFGDPLKIPRSNHFTITEPASSDALQHRLLVKFIESFLRPDEPALLSHRASPSPAEVPAIEQHFEMEVTPSAVWNVPTEQGVWHVYNYDAKFSAEEIEVFLREAQAAEAAGIEPPFKINFGWIQEASQTINESRSKTLSLEERKHIADVRLFHAEQIHRLEALTRCVRFVLDRELTSHYGWGALSIAESTQVILGLACESRDFGKGIRFNLVGPTDYVVVDVSYERCRELPYLGAESSIAELCTNANLYASDKQPLASMPDWFRYSKALPKLLQKYVFTESGAPDARDLPIHLGEWYVGLG
jgi:hypothetical protein